jgi:hypothetical protein
MTLLVLMVLSFACLGLALRAVETDPQNAGHGREPAALPLTEVILYSSGVGYFQRDGQVDGSATIDLRFKVDDINDLLKSLVVQDLDGGQVAAVSYGSREPIARTLKSFAIDLTENPTLGALLNQVRGQRVEVAASNDLTGTIIGVEKKKRPAGRDSDQEKPADAEFLTLLTDDGLRSILLEQVQRVRLLDDQLAGELRQALEVLASGQDTQKKTVALRFDGDGQRRVRVAYVIATAIWKTSYRLVLDESRAPYLQGWAIVENTTDDDWDGVRLGLISGRPISFVMDLYQPLYAPRPEVQPELYVSLRPQVYGQAMEMQVSTEPGTPPAATAAGAVEPRFKRARMGARGGGGFAAPSVGSVLSESAAVDPSQGVTAAASGLQAGELFEYGINTPVTLARQRSAMLPILGEDVEGEKLSIYNRSVQEKHPLNGCRLKNTSSLHLMQGPIAVFDAGSYAGDARIADLAPGSDCLISYALDLRVEVEHQHQFGPNVLVSAAVRKGTLVARRRLTEETVYNVRNRDRKEKIVLIEHPFRSDWKLLEPKAPAERTRDYYRFRVPIAAGKSERIRVLEERVLRETIVLSNLATKLISNYVDEPVVGEKVKEALREVIALRSAVDQTRAERDRREKRITEIAQEQGRIRENMAKLAESADLYKRYVKKLDQQETDLEALRKEIEALKDTEAREQQALDDFLARLDLDG